MMIMSFHNLSTSLKNGPGLHTLLPMVIFITMLPHLLSISPVISIYILSILAWFTLHTLGVFTLPGKLIKFILLILAIGLLVMNFGFFFSQRAFFTLLCLMVALKFLEIKNEQDRRNIFLLLFLGYFILIAHFLYSQSILLILFTLVNVILLTLMLINLNRLPQKSLSFTASLQLLLNLCVKAIPVAIVLFLFFPRIPGPLWSLPNYDQTGKTGLSDKMYPGSVTELVDSEEIAFRVDFDGPPPSADQLYWRGPVLTETDGFLWSQRPQKKLIKPIQQIIKTMNQPIAYTVTLEPHRQKWLFTLEMPTTIKGDTIKGYFFTTDLQVLNKINIHQLTQYHAISRTEFILNQTSIDEISEALKVTGSANPRTRQLGQQWRSINNNYEIVQTALNYFKEQPFYYTKRPDPTDENPSDEFLFDYRRGFCEHYASSFVLLMRYAGVPARVVTGYQGIEKNEVGDYYIVRQSNAHAWAEVWLDDRGWVRIDPTSMIPPNRIEPDIFNTSPERLNFLALNLPELRNLEAKHKLFAYRLWKRLNQTIDNIKHSWNNWILGYDQNKQNVLLKLLGFSASWQTLIILLVSGLVAVIMIFQLHRYYKNYQQIDRVYRSYLKLIKKLNKAGLGIKLSDAPVAVKQKAIQQFPEYQQSLSDIIDNYLLIRYGNYNQDHEKIKLLSQQIKQLQINPAEFTVLKQ